MSTGRFTDLAFARHMIRIGLRKYDELPAHRGGAAALLLMNSLRIARVFLGDAKVRAAVDQVLAERPISPIESVDR